MKNLTLLIGSIVAIVGGLLLVAGIGFALLTWRYHRQTHVSLRFLKYKDVTFTGGESAFVKIGWAREDVDTIPDLTVRLADGTKLHLPSVTQEDIADLANRVHVIVFLSM